MDEKPAFWDFLMAKWRTNRYSEFLRVYDKKSRTIIEYVKPDGKPEKIRRIFNILFLLIICSSTLICMELNWWPNLRFDLFFVTSLVYFSLDILLNKISYNKTIFEKVPEPDWDWKIYRKSKRPHRIRWIIIISIFVLMMVFVLMNSYSAFYIRHLIEGGTRNGSASITIYNSENSIVLDEDIQEGAVLNIGQQSEDKEVFLEVNTVKLPEQVSIYLNGQRLEVERNLFFDSSLDLFWESEYFCTTNYFSLEFEKFKENNTLEIKSGGFDKVWTFTLEYE